MDPPIRADAAALSEHEFGIILIHIVSLPTFRLPLSTARVAHRQADVATGQIQNRAGFGGLVREVQVLVARMTTRAQDAKKD